jgi:IS1 family transposase
LDIQYLPSCSCDSTTFAYIVLIYFRRGLSYARLKISLFLCFNVQISQPYTSDWKVYILLIETVPRVVTGKKNSPIVAHACRKRRLKWVLPRLGVGAQG